MRHALARAWQAAEQLAMSKKRALYHRQSSKPALPSTHSATVDMGFKFGVFDPEQGYIRPLATVCSIGKWAYEALRWSLATTSLDCASVPS